MTANSEVEVKTVSGYSEPACKSSSSLDNTDTAHHPHKTGSTPIISPGDPSYTYSRLFTVDAGLLVDVAVGAGFAGDFATLLVPGDASLDLEGKGQTDDKGELRFADVM